MKKGILLAIFFSILMFFSSVGALNVLKVTENKNESIIFNSVCNID